MSHETLFFSCFILFIIAVLALDLGILSRKSATVSFKSALIWTGVWVSFALGFFMFLKTNGHLIHGVNTMQDLQAQTQAYFSDLKFSGQYEQAVSEYNNELAVDFITGYLIEYSLSVDNLFVILLIFNSFAVPNEYYKKVLQWGVLGAIVLRLVFIFSGSIIVSQFHWVLYIFGGFLIYSGIKLLISKDEDENMDVDAHPMVKLASKYFKVFPEYVKGQFRHKADGVNFITPLFLVLLVVEFSDLIFAVDSVPAIFSVTNDPYIVFFSNIFAIMGLRSLFFLISNIMHLFSYLKYGLGVLLSFIGCKMVFEHWFKAMGIDNVMSLIIILSILAVSIVLSIAFPPKKVD